MLYLRSRTALASLRPLLLAVLCAFPLPSVSRAQSLWIPRDTPRAAFLELLHPDFDGLDEDLLMGAGFASLRTPVKGGWIVAEVPFARFSGEGVDAFSMGDLYVGLELPVVRTPIFLEAGVRPPLFDVHKELSDLTGVVSDLNRWDAYLDANPAFLAAVNARHVTPSGIALRGRAGANVVLLDAGFGYGTQTEVLAVYTGQVGIERPVFRAGAAFSGRTLLTEEGTFSERTETQADFHADFLSGMVRPGLEVKVPLGDLKEVVPVVIGLSLGLSLP